MSGQNKFKRLWIILAAVLAFIIILNVVQYSNYAKAQKAGIEITLEATDYFDDKLGNEKELVIAMYSFYNTANRSPSKGNYYDSLVVESAQQVLAAFEREMNDRGFTQYDDVSCFRYYGFMEFTAAKVGSLYIVWAVLAVILLIVQLASGKKPAPVQTHTPTPVNIAPPPSFKPVSTAEACPTEALMKYKELLDMGVITQEEFDAKKKQLLGL